MVVVYPVGVPIFFFVMLWTNRRSLETPDVLGRLGFLYKGYNKNVWYVAHRPLYSHCFNSKLIVHCDLLMLIGGSSYVICSTNYF
jgi:hypothetical protein